MSAPYRSLACLGPGVPHPLTNAPGVRQHAGTLDTSLQQGVHVVVVGPNEAQQTIYTARRLQPTAFIAVWHPAATEDAVMRTKAFAAGASMVTHCEESLRKAVDIAFSLTLQGSIKCDWCGMQGLTAHDYSQHHALYHADEEEKQDLCQACGRIVPALGWHLHEAHVPPPGHNIPPRTGVFALAVVRRKDGRFLLVQERGGEGYWLPGGGVDPGESLTAGAVRETLEEAGVKVRLLGVLCWDASKHSRTRRVTFYAEPEDESQLPKTLPDIESVGACWVDIDQLKDLKLRSTHDLRWLRHLADGGSWEPLQMPGEWVAAFQGWPLFQ